MKRGRPYPKDAERRRRVRVELAKRDLTIASLSRELGLCRTHVNETINGIRRSPGIEDKIAAFFGMPVELLFPRLRRRDIATGGAS